MAAFAELCDCCLKSFNEFRPMTRREHSRGPVPVPFSHSILSPVEGHRSAASRLATFEKEFVNSLNDVVCCVAIKGDAHLPDLLVYVVREIIRTHVALDGIKNAADEAIVLPRGGLLSACAGERIPRLDDLANRGALLVR
jgi:hypothetical protein